MVGTHTTFNGLLVLLPSKSPTSSATSSISPPNSQDSVSTAATSTDNNSSVTQTWRTGSTVWGPGALTGKLVKWVGEGVVRGAEVMVIQTKLSKFEKTQQDLLGFGGRLTAKEEEEVQYQCRKLVELCIIGMEYPSNLMTRAFKIVLRGFCLPRGRIWSYYIAEAIAEFGIVEVFEIFYEGFFTLLDDSIFRLKGFIDHETLRFRCPVVAHEIAIIISHLAHKDRTNTVRPVRTRSIISVTPSETSVGDAVSHLHPIFSRAIIEAGFFRLVRRWGDRGMPHWDQAGISCLGKALKDVADALEYHSDTGSAEEARELMQKLQDRHVQPQSSDL